MRPVVLLGLLLVAVALAPGARGEDEAGAPRSTRQAAEAVAAAVEAQDADALQALAAADEPDPWRVADELCRGGRHDAATVFADVAVRPDTQRLAAYVAAARERGSDAADRDRYDALDAVFDDDPQRIVDATADLDAGPSTLSQLDLLELRADALRALARDEEAEAELRRAADAAVALGWLRGATAYTTRAGWSALRRREPEVALAAFQRAHDLCARRAHVLDQARACCHLGHVHRTSGDAERAVGEWRQALTLLQGLEGTVPAAQRLLAMTHNEIARLQVERRDYESALYSLRQAEALATGLKDTGLLATLQGNKGQALLGLSRFGDALRLFEGLLPGARELPERQVEATTLNNIALAHESLGHYAEARTRYEQAVGLFESGDDPASAATARANLGNMLRLLGDWDGAERELGSALAAQQDREDARGEARTRSHLGSLRAGQGRYREAKGELETAYDLFQEHGDPAGMARVRSKQGAVDQALGNYPQALRTYEDAYDALKVIGDRAGAVETLINMGAVHQLLGDAERARARLEEALAAATLLEKRDSQASALVNLGSVLQSVGAYEEALAMYERARAAFRDVGDRGKERQALNNIGVAQMALRRHDDAFRTYVGALAAMDASGDVIGRELARGNLGEVRQHLTTLPEPAATAPEHVELATRLFAETAESLLAKSAEELRNRRALPLEVAVQGMLARLYLDTDRPREALATAQAAARTIDGLLGSLDDERGATARAPYADLFAVGALAARRADKWAELAEFLERARAGALLDSLEDRRLLQRRLRKLPPGFAVALEQAASERTVAAHAYGQALARGEGAAIREALKALDAANDAVRDAQGRIELELKGMGSPWSRTLSSLDDMRATLEPHQALVLYGLLEDAKGARPIDEALALVVERDAVRAVDLGSASRLRADCAPLAVPAPQLAPGARGAGRAEEPDDVEAADPWQAAVALGRERLVEPLGLAAHVTQVLVSPDGLLGLVPFGLLLEGRTFAMTPSGTTTTLLRQQRGADGRGEGILALGNPDYGSLSRGALANFNDGQPVTPLPATAREVEAIGTVRLLGPAASEKGLARALGSSVARTAVDDAWDALLRAKKDPADGAAPQEVPRRRGPWRAVHFACHGLIHPRQPMLSALALSAAGEDDGFLTALEILGLDLNAELAVLSACDSSRGRIVEGEGLVGFTRAFMLAGSPRVVCSLWKADDEATAALMMRFYALWNPKDGGPGLSTAEALQGAQAFVRDQERWAAPYFWAGWALWGLPD